MQCRGMEKDIRQESKMKSEEMEKKKDEDDKGAKGTLVKGEEETRNSEEGESVMGEKGMKQEREVEEQVNVEMKSVNLEASKDIENAVQDSGVDMVKQTVVEADGVEEEATDVKKVEDTDMEQKEDMKQEVEKVEAEETTDVEETNKEKQEVADVEQIKDISQVEASGEEMTGVEQTCAVKEEDVDQKGTVIGESTCVEQAGKSGVEETPQAGSPHSHLPTMPSLWNDETENKSDLEFFDFDNFEVVDALEEEEEAAMGDGGKNKSSPFSPQTHKQQCSSSHQRNRSHEDSRSRNRHHSYSSHSRERPRRGQEKEDSRDKGSSSSRSSRTSSRYKEERSHHTHSRDDKRKDGDRVSDRHRKDQSSSRRTHERDDAKAKKQSREDEGKSIRRTKHDDQNSIKGTMSKKDREVAKQSPKISSEKPAKMPSTSERQKHHEAKDNSLTLDYAGEPKKAGPEFHKGNMEKMEIKEDENIKKENEKVKLQVSNTELQLYNKGLQENYVRNKENNDLEVSKDLEANKNELQLINKDLEAHEMEIEVKNELESQITKYEISDKEFNPDLESQPIMRELELLNNVEINSKELEPNKKELQSSIRESEVSNNGFEPQIKESKASSKDIKSNGELQLQIKEQKNSMKSEPKDRESEPQVTTGIESKPSISSDPQMKESEPSQVKVEKEEVASNQEAPGSQEKSIATRTRSSRRNKAPVTTPRRITRSRRKITEVKPEEEVIKKIAVIKEETEKAVETVDEDGQIDAAERKVAEQETFSTHPQNEETNELTPLSDDCMNVTADENKNIENKQRSPNTLQEDINRSIKEEGKLDIAPLEDSEDYRRKDQTTRQEDSQDVTQDQDKTGQPQEDSKLRSSQKVDSSDSCQEPKDLAHSSQAEDKLEMPHYSIREEKTVQKKGDKGVTSSKEDGHRKDNTNSNETQQVKSNKRPQKSVEASSKRKRKDDTKGPSATNHGENKADGGKDNNRVESKKNKAKTKKTKTPDKSGKKSTLIKVGRFSKVVVVGDARISLLATPDIKELLKEVTQVVVVPNLTLEGMLEVVKKEVVKEGEEYPRGILLLCLAGLHGTLVEYRVPEECKAAGHSDMKEMVSAVKDDSLNPKFPKMLAKLKKNLLMVLGRGSRVLFFPVLPVDMTNYNAIAAKQHFEATGHKIEHLQDVDVLHHRPLRQYKNATAEVNGSAFSSLKLVPFEFYSRLTCRRFTDELLQDGFSPTLDLVERHILPSLQRSARSNHALRFPHVILVGDPRLGQMVAMQQLKGVEPCTFILQEEPGLRSITSDSHVMKQLSGMCNALIFLSVSLKDLTVPSAAPAGDCEREKAQCSLPHEASKLFDQFVQEAKRVDQLMHSVTQHCTIITTPLIPFNDHILAGDREGKASSCDKCKKTAVLVSQKIEYVNRMLSQKNSLPTWHLNYAVVKDKASKKEFKHNLKMVQGAASALEYFLYSLQAQNRMKPRNTITSILQDPKQLSALTLKDEEIHKTNSSRSRDREQTHNRHSSSSRSRAKRRRRRSSSSHRRSHSASAHPALDDITSPASSLVPEKHTDRELDSISSGDINLPLSPRPSSINSPEDFIDTSHDGSLQVSYREKNRPLSLTPSPTHQRSFTRWDTPQDSPRRRLRSVDNKDRTLSPQRPWRSSVDELQGNQSPARSRERVHSTHGCPSPALPLSKGRSRSRSRGMDRSRSIGRGRRRSRSKASCRSRSSGPKEKAPRGRSWNVSPARMPHSPKRRPLRRRSLSRSLSPFQHLKSTTRGRRSISGGRSPVSRSRRSASRSKSPVFRNRRSVSKGRSPVFRNRRSMSRGKSPISRDRRSVSRGKSPISRDRRSVSRGRSPISRDRRSVSRGRSPISRDRRSVPRGKCSISRDRRSVSRARRSASMGRRSASRGRRSVSRGRRSVSRARRSVSRGRRSVSRGRRSISLGRAVSRSRRSTSRGKIPVSRCWRSVSRSRRSISRDRQSISKVRRSISRGRRSISRGRRNISRGRSISRGRRSISRGRRSLSRGRRSLSRGRRSISRGRRSISRGRRSISRGRRSISRGRSFTMRDRRGMISSREQRKSVKLPTQQEMTRESMVKEALKTLRSVHEKECEKYRLNPTIHPSIGMEYTYFCQRKTQSILALGGDPMQYNMAGEWRTFWRMRLEEIFDDSWRIKRQQCLDALDAHRKPPSPRPALRAHRSSSVSSSSSSDSYISSSSKNQQKRSSKNKKRRKKRRRSSSSEDRERKRKDFVMEKSSPKVYPRSGFAERSPDLGKRHKDRSPRDYPRAQLSEIRSREKDQDIGDISMKRVPDTVRSKQEWSEKRMERQMSNSPENAQAGRRVQGQKLGEKRKERVQSPPSMVQAVREAQRQKEAEMREEQIQKRLPSPPETAEEKWSQESRKQLYSSPPDLKVVHSDSREHAPKHSIRDLIPMDDLLPEVSSMVEDRVVQPGQHRGEPNSIAQDIFLQLSGKKSVSVGSGSPKMVASESRRNHSDLYKEHVEWQEARSHDSQACQGILKLDTMQPVGSKAASPAHPGRPRDLDGYYIQGHKRSKDPQEAYSALKSGKHKESITSIFKTFAADIGDKSGTTKSTKQGHEEEVSSTTALDGNIRIHIDVVNVLEVLTHLGDKLGALCAPLKLVHGRAEELKKNGADPMAIINDTDNKFLLQMIQEKLQGILKDGQLNIIKKVIVQEAEQRLSVLLERQKKRSLLGDLNLTHLARRCLDMDAATTVAYIREVLLCRGQTCPSQQQLMELYMAVKEEQLKVVGDRRDDKAAAAAAAAFSDSSKSSSQSQLLDKARPPGSSAPTLSSPHAEAHATVGHYDSPPWRAKQPQHEVPHKVSRGPHKPLEPDPWWEASSYPHESAQGTSRSATVHPPEAFSPIQPSTSRSCHATQPHPKDSANPLTTHSPNSPPQAVHREARYHQESPKYLYKKPIRITLPKQQPQNFLGTYNPLGGDDTDSEGY